MKGRLELGISFPRCARLGPFQREPQAEAAERPRDTSPWGGTGRDLPSKVGPLVEWEGGMEEWGCGCRMV